jgi:hypothetical protein
MVYLVKCIPPSKREAWLLKEDGLTLGFVNDYHPARALPFSKKEEAEAFLARMAVSDSVAVKRSEWSIITYDGPLEVREVSKVEELVEGDDIGVMDIDL